MGMKMNIYKEMGEQVGEENREGRSVRSTASWLVEPIGAICEEHRVTDMQRKDRRNFLNEYSPLHG